MDPNPSANTPPSLQEPLSDADCDRLAFLLERSDADDAMDLEQMDGFYAALICAPELVPPGECLEEIWGDADAPFESVEELREFLDLSMRHWNRVASALADENQVFEPLLWAEDDEELPRGNRWAEGFLRGISMRRECWKELFADDDKFAMLLPIFALAHENDPDPEMRSWKTPPDRELRKRLIIGLAVATQQVYDYFRTHRAREARRRPSGESAASRKIGRNDPCYCGSGKKYKRCCGNVTIN